MQRASPETVSGREPAKSFAVSGRADIRVEWRGSCMVVQDIFAGFGMTDRGTETWLVKVTRKRNNV